jgi:hypothetical protein
VLPAPKTESARALACTPRHTVPADTSHRAWPAFWLTCAAIYPVTIDPLASTAGTTLTGLNANDAFVPSVALVGDLNGDGYADFVAGAPGYASNKGRGYVSLGAAVLSNINNVPQNIEGETAGDRFGSSLSGDDANGDGYDDVLAGAPGTSGNRATPTWPSATRAGPAPGPCASTTPT